MKLAIVHDYLNQYGGAERIIEIFHEMFPEAPIYTSIYSPEKLPRSFRQMDIRPSFMTKLPWSGRLVEYYLPLFPLAFESFDLRGYDVILSSTTAWAKGPVRPLETIHICYCNTPMRFAWRTQDYLEQREMAGLIQQAVNGLLSPLRMWDLIAANQVDYFIANSYNIARRIAKFYRRDSVIIHCPVDCSTFRISPTHDDYFLVVSRLKPYKRIDLVVEVFNRLGLSLKIVGEGSDRLRLEAMAGPTIEFLGRVSDEQLRQYYARCRALIFPGEEDFGLVPVEVQASGRPVIAYGAGGALETVQEGVTGRLFYPQTVNALVEVVRSWDDHCYDPETIRRHALQFDVTVFRDKIYRFVEKCLTENGLPRPCWRVC